jgi:hypothetical protein
MKRGKIVSKKLVLKEARDGLLTRKEFQTLADVPPEVEWFANIDNARTRRAYQIDLRDFMQFVGIDRPQEFRTVGASKQRYEIRHGVLSEVRIFEENP